jgi:hypothetical protein
MVRSLSIASMHPLALAMDANALAVFLSPAWALHRAGKSSCRHSQCISETECRIIREHPSLTAGIHQSAAKHARKRVSPSVA